MIVSGSVLDGVVIKGKPLLSVFVITYNHENYIKQCLDGILMQEVNFPYEILIHDDASPDNTADIIREYEIKYPGVIKPIYQIENQYSKGVKIGKFNRERAQGKYIAQCEGDDYWTDPNKLQMQVDFLENHSEYIGTVHSVDIVDINGNPKKILKGSWLVYTNDHVFSVRCLNKRWLAGQTASLVYRNIYMEIDPSILQRYDACDAHGDRKLTTLLACTGNIYCFGRVMSCYRQVTHTGTSMSAQFNNRPPAKWNYLMEKAICDFAQESFHITIDPSYEYCRLISAGILYLLRHPNSVAFEDVWFVIRETKVKKSQLMVYMYKHIMFDIIFGGVLINKLVS